jgi:DNA-directed RNA polymerase subunit RPC12/RpoP
VHDHPTPDDSDYAWPTCLACGTDLWLSELGRLACRPCEEKTSVRIAELPALFRQLDTTAALMRGARRPGGGSSGSKTPPIPPRLEVLALVGPGGVAARLAAIEDAWRKSLGWTVAPWRGSPAQAVPQHATFLANNLPWACDAYESVGQDIDDLRRLHGECAAIVNDERRPGRVQIGACPGRYDDGLCGQPLTASAASHRVRCGNCGSRWETLGEWRELRAAQEAVLAEAERQEQEEVAA